MSGKDSLGRNQNPNLATGTGGSADRSERTTTDLAEQARETAGQVAGQVKKQTSSVINTQKEKAAEGIGGIAQALRQTGEQLGAQQAGTTQQYVEQAADGLERVSDYIQRTDINEMLDGVQDLARREPALFFGGALALGLLAGRFIKSSAPPAPRASSRERRYPEPPRGVYENRELYGRGYGVPERERTGYTGARQLPYEGDVPSGYTRTTSGQRPAGTPGVAPSVTPTPPLDSGLRGLDKAAENRPGRGPGRGTEEL